MNEPSLPLRRAADTLVAAIALRLSHGVRPLVVAIDGRSGSGKSTLAALVAPAVGGTIVPSDDFFAATIPDSGWEARTMAERSADALDWRRLRAEALEPLRAGKPAQWRAFDFAGGIRPDGTYAMQSEPTRRPSSSVILLDGAYSAGPALADLIDLAVLIEAPQRLRDARLAARENPRFLAQWHARWDGAEDHYFSDVRPAASFHLVLAPATAE